MNGKVSPVSIPVKAPSDRVEKVDVNLRCTKCQLIMPCSCSSNARRVSEVQLLNYELSEKQELAAETVRGMQTRRRKSVSTDAGNPPKAEPTTKKSTEKRITLEDFVIETEKMADVGFSASNATTNWFSRGSTSAKNMFKVSTDNKLALKLYGNKAAVVMEQRRQAQKGDGVIHPFSTFRWYWDIVMVILITTHVLLLPVSIAFVDQELSPSWLALNCVSDAVFIVDIFLNFRTGVIDFSRQEEVILDKKFIRTKYLRGWFIIDVLSSLPFDYVYIIASSGSSGNPDSEILQASRILRILKLTKLLSLLKLLRVSRIVRYIKELEELLNIQSGQMRILKLIGCMLLLSHWNGCVQFLIPRLMDFPDNSWVSLNGLKDKPSFHQYSWSLFNAMSHMLCIGYGRFPPNNITELWVMLCSMTIGATFYAVFIGIMSTLIMSIDSSGRLYKEKLNQVGEYMRYRKLPLQIRRRVQDYYEHRYHHKLFDEDAILAELSYPLREEIQIHNARSLLTSVPFFSNTSEEFISLCVTLLKFEVFLPGDIVFKRGSKGDRMYFIVRGIVDILTTDGFVATSLTDGSHFGEISLMREDGRRTATCRAATMLDLYSLNTSDFRTVLDAFPGMQSVLSDVAVERLQRLDKYSDEARLYQVKRDYKTEKITSNEMENTDINKKRLGAMKIPTLTKGFIRSMAPTLGVATLNESETTTSRELPSIGEGETGLGCSDWTSVVPEGHDETTADIQTEMEGKEYRE